MLGLMQDWPLLCHRIIDHAAANAGERRVISRSIEGPMHTTNYIEIRQRALRVAQRLERDGIRLGDRVATLAWNTWRHLESWYGILGAGAVYHTVNPRLFTDQIVWIINHAEDRVLMTDVTFLPLLEKIADRVPTIERTIVFCDAAHMPVTSLGNAVPYEEWLAEADGDFAWRSFDENTAAGMCYTSGTTGNPKGVVYSHRSNVLHAMAALRRDMIGLSGSDIAMPVVPLFHANGWAIGFAAPMAGAALILPGPKLDGPSIYQLLTDYKVTCTAGVPTVWLALLQELEKTGGKLPYLRRVVIGGSACPRAMISTFQDVYDVEVTHAWGMTEMSPLGTTCSLKPEYAGLKGDPLLDILQKQGHSPFGVEMKITDDEGRRMPWNGKTFGRLKVRGPAIAKTYFKDDSNILDEEGFFDTGDVGTIDRYGYLNITDRSKDVIKSGGEWISSIEVEPSVIPKSPRPRSSACGIRSGMSGLCSSSCLSRGRRRAEKSCWRSSRARSPNGGCQTTSLSSPKSRTPRPERFKKRRCARSLRITCCRAPQREFYSARGKWFHISHCNKLMARCN